MLISIYAILDYYNWVLTEINFFLNS